MNKKIKLTNKKKKNKKNNIDLRLCMVREMKQADRRNCFEIVSPIK